LALVQAQELKHRLAAAYGVEAPALEIVPIRTTGDVIQDRALAAAGGKGLFTKELDTALLRGEIDFAVHSAKDLPTFLPQGISIAGYLPREDVRDAWISAKAADPRALPPGSIVGTASLRRSAMLLRLRPDLAITLLRGNVETRLAKLARGEIDATILALAGLKRLKLADKATRLLDTVDFVPAVGQGAIGITARSDDAPVAAALAPILDLATGVALDCERALLQVLDGSCRTPIGGHAWLDGDILHLRAIILRPDGSQFFETQIEGPRAEAINLGESAARELLARAPAGFLAGRRC
jgi:hydroxymethylbilane synthase